MKVGDTFMFFNPHYLQLPYSRDYSNGLLFKIVSKVVSSEGEAEVACLESEDGDENDLVVVDDHNNISPSEFREMTEGIPECYILLNGKTK